MLSIALRERERELLAEALRDTQGRVAACAGALRLPLRTLQAKIAAHGLWGRVRELQTQGAGELRGAAPEGANPSEGPTNPGV